MRIEWDPRKAAANRRKHGVSFEEAATAFDDELGAYYPDALREDRFILIGYSHEQRLRYVVYAEVTAEFIRIISARKATKMKKRITRTTDPLDKLVDFDRFGPVRRNAFAGADERGGPSLLALWKCPSSRRMPFFCGAAILGRGRARPRWPARFACRRASGEKSRRRHEPSTSTFIRRCERRCCPGFDGQARAPDPVLKAAGAQIRLEAQREPGWFRIESHPVLIEALVRELTRRPKS